MLGTSTLELQYYLPNLWGRIWGWEKNCCLFLFIQTASDGADIHMQVQSLFTCSKTHILFNTYWSHIGKTTPVLYLLSLKYFWPSFTPLTCFLCLCFGLNWSFPITVIISELIFLTLIFHLCQLSIYHLSTSNSPLFSFSWPFRYSLLCSNIRIPFQQPKPISFGQRDDLLSRTWRKSFWLLEFEEFCKFQIGIYTSELANGPFSQASCFLLSLMMGILGESDKLTMMYLIERHSIAKEISS